MSIVSINMRPPRIAGAFTLLAAASHWLFGLRDGPRFSLPWVGVVSGLIGFFTMMWAWWLFKRRNLAVCPTAPTAGIILHGLYRFSRNPMYLGMVLMLFGLAICVGTPPFYLSAIGFFLAMNTVFCPYEEDKLSKEFGEVYRSYAKQVPRWI